MLTAQAKDVGLLLQQVADTCALVAERVEADRIERRAFVEAIGRLAQSPEALESGEHPLGGTVFPASELVPPEEPPAEERKRRESTRAAHDRSSPSRRDHRSHARGPTPPVTHPPPLGDEALLTLRSHRDLSRRPHPWNDRRAGFGTRVMEHRLRVRRSLVSGCLGVRWVRAGSGQVDGQSPGAVGPEHGYGFASVSVVDAR